VWQCLDTDFIPPKGDQSRQPRLFKWCQMIWIDWSLVSIDRKAKDQHYVSTIELFRNWPFESVQSIYACIDLNIPSGPLIYFSGSRRLQAIELIHLGPPNIYWICFDWLIKMDTSWFLYSPLFWPEIFIAARTMTLLSLFAALAILLMIFLIDQHFCTE
jgi:hypothetical protein